MIQKIRFQEGEKVLCFHGPLIYEAKCLKILSNDENVMYRIHYQGWNKNWDEWVHDTRILKWNDENLQIQSEVNAANKSQRKPSNKKRVSLQENDATSSNENGSAKKRPRPASVEDEETYRNKIQIDIKIPVELKPILLEDWDFINKQKKLISLPARVSIDTILNDYSEYKKGKVKSKENTVQELCTGIKEYFHCMLPKQLLYKFERSQHKQYLEEHTEVTSMTEIYGVVHLLRLFVKLGEMLVYTALDEKGISTLLSHLQDLLKFLSKNIHYYSTQDYIPASGASSQEQ